MITLAKKSSKHILEDINFGLHKGTIFQLSAFSYQRSAISYQLSANH
jgi:hypothetical protein